MTIFLLAGGLVLGRDVEDAVGIDVEGHLDLRYAAPGPAGYREVELAQDLLGWARSRSPCSM
jgi:hypothetical protein